jgi:hypothetical protein
MARYLIPSKNGMTVPPSVVRANREFDRQMRAGVLCVACAREFGPKVPKHPRLTDCCVSCGNDF